MQEASDQLSGRWNLREALRDDTPTETLQSLYLHFLSDSLVATNFSGEDQQVAYALEGRQRIVLHMPAALELGIETLSDTVLVLGANINESQFHLRFSKEKN